MGLNMFTQGVDPKLDFHNLPKYRDLFERCTGMHIGERQPYVGQLVFTAFSGSHQDAINKGHEYMEKSGTEYWEIPYLPIDPADVGREYEPIIRINSQSGKGGAAYVMQHTFGYHLPKDMHAEFGALIKAACDEAGREITPEEVFEVFKKEYRYTPKHYKLLACRFVDDERINRETGEHDVHFIGSIAVEGKEIAVESVGNGPLDAFFNALPQVGIEGYSFMAYHEHAISSGSDSKAVAYIRLHRPDGRPIYGVGVSGSINRASVKGVLNAINRSVFQG